MMSRMICVPCRNGGDISTKIRTGQTPAHLGRPAADAQHNLCRGGTWCDCHHGVSPAPRRMPGETPDRAMTAAAGWCAPA